MLVSSYIFPEAISGNTKKEELERFTAWRLKRVGSNVVECLSIVGRVVKYVGHTAYLQVGLYGMRCIFDALPTNSESVEKREC